MQFAAVDSSGAIHVHIMSSRVRCIKLPSAVGPVLYACQCPYPVLRHTCNSRSSENCNAVECVYARGSCNAQPCPGSALASWVDCTINTVPADGCPSGCKAIPSSDGGRGLCVVRSASATSVTSDEVTAIQDCYANPSIGCASVFVRVRTFVRTG